MFKVKGNGLRDYFIVVKTSIDLRKGISKLYFVCFIFLTRIDRIIRLS